MLSFLLVPFSKGMVKPFFCVKEVLILLKEVSILPKEVLILWKEVSILPKEVLILWKEVLILTKNVAKANCIIIDQFMAKLEKFSDFQCSKREFRGKKAS